MKLQNMEENTYICRIYKRRYTNAIILIAEIYGGEGNDG